MSNFRQFTERIKSRLKPTLCALFACMFTLFISSNAYALDLGCAAGGYIKAGTTNCTPCTAGSYCPGQTGYNLPQSSDIGIYSCPTEYPESAEGSKAKTSCYSWVVFYPNGTTAYPVTYWGNEYTTGYKSTDGSASAPYTKAYYPSSTTATETCTVDSAKWCKAVNSYYYLTNLPTLFSLTVGPGGAATATQQITRPGYTLHTYTSGNYSTVWTKTKNGTNPVYANSNTANRLTGRTNLYAKWDPIDYTISYTLNSGTQASGQYTTYNADQLPITLKNPTRTGYTFAGWCDNSGLSTNCSTSKKIAAGATGNKTFYAKWTPKILTITLNKQSGSGGTSTIYEKYATGWYTDSSASTQITTSSGITVPTRTGYTFGGYYTSTGGGGTQILLNTGKLKSGASTTTFTTNGTLYAKWTPTNYTITYVLNDGACSGGSCTPTSYNIESSTITLPTPTKSGYTFGGWYTTSNFSGSAVTQIASGSTGNKTYYAKWNVKNCNAGYYISASDPTVCTLCPAGSWCPGVTNATFSGSNIGINACPSSYPNSISQIGNNYTETWLPTSASSCYKTQTVSCSTYAPYSTVWSNGTIQQYDVTSGNLSSSASGTAMQFNDGSGNWHLLSGCGLPDLRYTYLTTDYANNWTCNTGYQLGYFNETFANSAYSLVSRRCRAADDSYNTDDITGLALGEWDVTTTGGTTKGTSACSFSSSSFLPTIDNLGGPNCYCQATSFTPTNGSAQSVTPTWFLASSFGSWKNINVSGTKHCETDCAGICMTFYHHHDSLGASYMFAAQCQPISYTVYFKPAGASGTISRSPLTCKYDQNCDLTNTGSGYYKTGYDFAGWKSGDAVNVYPSSTVIPGTNAVHNLASAEGSSVYLYAQWTPTNYTITYNLNDGTCSGGSCAPTSYNIESSTITLPTPTRLGYDFGGWYETSVFSGNAVATIPTGSYGNKTYYAKWITKEIHCDAGYYIPANSETCNAICPADSWCMGGNYMFNGGATGIESCPTAYPHSPEGSDGVVDCYATITYVLNGGSAIQYNPRNWGYNSNHPNSYNINPFPTTTKTGYSVTWWTTEDFQSGTQVDETTDFVGDQTLYAKWTANTINLTWDGGYTGSTYSASNTCTYDGAITLPATSPTRTGYIFNKWKVHD